MLEWILVLYAVGTNHPVWNDAGRYSTEQQCETAANQVVDGGRAYAVCDPVQKQP